MQLLAAEKKKKKDVELQLEREKLKSQTLEKQNHRKSILSSVSRCIVSSRKKSVPLSTSLPSCVQLSEDVLVISDNIIGEGTFGVVKLGFFKTLKVKCAIKIGKTTYFDAVHECRILQKVQGCCYFPYVYGVLENLLVMEFVGEDEDVRTVWSEKKRNHISQNQWTDICYSMTNAIVYMHKKGLLHNDLKSNNVLLKEELDGSFVPKIIDMGKVTTKRDSPIYQLTPKQKERYNKYHSYLAPELRNNYGAKCSIYSDVYSLGVIFAYVADTDNFVLQSLIPRMKSSTPLSRLNTYEVFKELGKLKKRNSQSVL